MIHKLRKKFIFAAILAVFLVLLLLIGAINVLNYRSMVAEAALTQQIMRMTGESNGYKRCKNPRKRNQRLDRTR